MEVEFVNRKGYQRQQTYHDGIAHCFLCICRTIGFWVEELEDNSPQPHHGHDPCGRGVQVAMQFKGPPGRCPARAAMDGPVSTVGG